MSARLHTVTGLLDAPLAGIADGHTHVWIENVGAVDPNPMILDDVTTAVKELSDFYQAGGRLMVDCQPGGCGRNGAKLHQISQLTGVAIIASTGFHLRRYYPLGTPIFDMDEDTALRHFVSELTTGLAESSAVRAGIIKIACEDTLARSPQALIRAAARASTVTGAAIEVHTERGSDAEAIAAFMLDVGMSPGKLILCHLDKRPDFTVHRQLVSLGVMLEYDTFLRPQYHPDENAIPLLLKMVAAGYEDQIILATDLADVRMWRHIGNGPGASALVTQIIKPIIGLGVPEQAAAKLAGGNIVRCAAF